MSRKPVFALVTGCGKGGIGEALVVEYTHRGIYAIATLLPSEPSDHLSSVGIPWFPLDVTQEKSIRNLKKELSSVTGGRLDILVNNAGICYTMTAIDSDIETVKNMFNVNLFGPMRMIYHLHDMLIRSSGTIVNISSIGGVVPYVYGSSYNATKAALAHWSNTLRVEMAPLDVNVITVISGEVSTNILKSDANNEIPKGSYYFPLAEEFQQHVRRTPNAMDRFVYARNVAAQSLKSSPPAWFWFGNASLFIRLLDALAFRTVWDYLFWDWFNLAKLKKAHKLRKQD